MNQLDAVGYIASVLVFAAFCMKDMVPLRLVAVCSNVAFLAFGLGLGLMPVLLLHAILLPINCWRLWQAFFPKLVGVQQVSATTAIAPHASERRRVSAIAGAMVHQRQTEFLPTRAG